MHVINIWTLSVVKNHQLNCIEAPASAGFAIRPPAGLCPYNLAKSLPVPHVDLGTGLLQYRPKIIELVGMVSVGIVGVGMVPATHGGENALSPNFRRVLGTT